jgi:phosphoribosylformimino-5-aminoimidazole carboxamide ribotide isomerase
MIILPAIDLLDGKAVRLVRGDYDAVTVYNDDPVDQARFFEEEGATWLHIVDLDGARSGVPTNSAIIKHIIDATSLKIEVGGGVRDMCALKRLIDAGANRVVIGTALVKDPSFAQAAVERYGDAICAGVDARGGEVSVEGWREGGGVPASVLIRQLKNWGIRHLVYTDIARDGMQSGIDAEAYASLAAEAGFAITASGGIATLDDLRNLTAVGEDRVWGAICGRAIYENSFSVSEAIRIAK